jgi:thioredoxin-like negative regulator of GroEL
MKIKQINDQNFSTVLKSCDKPIVIKFYNPTCHLCSGLKPVYEQLSMMFNDYEFAECNANNSRKMFKFFKVSGVPTVFIVDKDSRKEIPYPQNPDPDSGYSLYDMADFLDSFNKR